MGSNERENDTKMGSVVRIMIQRWAAMRGKMIQR